MQHQTAHNCEPFDVANKKRKRIIPMKAGMTRFFINSKFQVRVHQNLINSLLQLQNCEQCDPEKLIRSYGAGKGQIITICPFLLHKNVKHQVFDIYRCLTFTGV